MIVFGLCLARSLVFCMVFPFSTKVSESVLRAKSRFRKLVFLLDQKKENSPCEIFINKICNIVSTKEN